MTIMASVCAVCALCSRQFAYLRYECALRDNQHMCPRRRVDCYAKLAREGEKGRREGRLEPERQIDYFVIM